MSFSPTSSCWQHHLTATLSCPHLLRAGISIFYDGTAVWENLGDCENQGNCEPISLFADAAWHAVEMNISPTAAGGAVVTFQLTTSSDRHGTPILSHGFATVPVYTLPSPAFFGFSGRTGGATNNHWCITTNARVVLSPLPATSSLCLA